MAKKDNGKPKNDYPNLELKMLVKTAKVKENRFSVVFTQAAVVEAVQDLKITSAANPVVVKIDNPKPAPVM